MHIKEVIIDGFKSYAHRTVVSGFDPLFNAITGLNGSGKSNILDAICFVLGISNLSQVRAGSLQELVYKQGQAGVSRATVSIVFDNADKPGSPVGYEQHDEITVTRQVVIGGRNKYLINGHNAQPSRVQNLFHSVQLNVNNPHFLIMQGRITKVLNMKPPEILSMIEEAAGTRMFETKKMAARKTIEKKAHKLSEITALLEEEITPTLEKLRKERTSYLNWQKNKAEIEHLSRFVTAYAFWRANLTLTESQKALEEMVEEKKHHTKTLRTAETDVANLKQNADIVAAKRDAEMGNELKDLESAVAEASKKLIKANAAWDHKREARSAEEAARAAHATSIKDGEAAVSDKTARAEKLAQDAAAAEEAHTTAKDALAKEEVRCHAVAMGMVADESGEDKTLADQLKDQQASVTAAATELKTIKMRIDHAKKELKTKAPAAKKSAAEYKKMTAKLSKYEADVASAQAALDALSYDEAAMSGLETRASTNATKLSAVRETVESLQARLGRLQFSYSDPEPGFDRTKVSGLVASLIKVKAPAAATALEVTAGSRLYNVVVDNEVTGKKLLSKGKLRSRVTIIPLNKIRARQIDPRAVALAKSEVGAENADLALSLVGYEDDVAAAMQYVFGNTMICKSMEEARKVTFNKKINARSVTLDGDVFDPSGTLTGGAASKGSGVLAQLERLNAAQTELARLEAEKSELDASIAALAGVAKKHATFTETLELKSHELGLVRTRIEQSTLHQAMEEVRVLEETVATATETIDACKARKAKGEDKCKELQAEIKGFAAGREKRVKAAEKAKDTAKKAVAKARDAAAEATAAYQAAMLEIEALQAEIEAGATQDGEFAANIAALLAEEEELELAVAERKERYDVADGALAEKRGKLSGYEAELRALSDKVAELTKAKNTAELALTKLVHTIDKRTRERRSAAATVEKLGSEHPWIANERQYFGQTGTSYDFSGKGAGVQDPTQATRRLKEMEEAQAKLSKSINTKVLAMFDKAEKEYNDLLKKKIIVEEDKAKIESAIEELDQKKNDVLTKAHTQVNRDFGSIFSTLLPGTQAKLEPVEGMSILDGLRVRVAFGEVWKESLTELSGGQRSLVALSLILSLLLFKPAPLYILDEVDAALDLSHTQNIGQMLRTHFNKSQFVVVSLKDGMFNNANVLFKTKFVDGVSTVRRYAQVESTTAAASAGSAPAGKENKKASASAGKRAGGRSRARSALTTSQ